MNWFTLSCFLFGLFVGVARHKRRRPGPAEKPSKKTPEQTDPVRDALSSGDIEKMIEAAGQKTTPDLRHDLLQEIVTYAYKRRTDPTMRRYLAEHARIYIDELPELFPAAERKYTTRPLYLPVIKLYAIHLEEEKAYDEAVRVCRLALEYNLDDQTKTGFEGRIQRIMKKKISE